MAGSTFQDRLVRINSGKQIVGEGLTLNKTRHASTSRWSNNLHLHMLVAGALIGGVFGVLFAFNVGLSALVGLDVEALYQFVLSDWMIGALIGGVAIAPIGFIFALMLARSLPGGFVFWIGYLGGVIAANRAEIEAYAATLQAAAVG